MHHGLAAFLLAGSLLAQAMVPPFDTTHQVVVLGHAGNVLRYGGMAFSPTDANVLLVSPYASGHVVAVPVLRDALGVITGFGGGTVVANVSATDGGLAVGPGNVLFGTGYGPNVLYQVRPGDAVANRTDPLAALGVPYSVGACTFVPAGLPGAGSLKVCSWGPAQLHDVPLTPDGNGTFAPGAASAPINLPDYCEGLVYLPSGMPTFGGELMFAEYEAGNVVAYQLDANGNPVVATRTVVMAGLYGVGGGVVDPITGDVLFTLNDGTFVALRSGAACGTFTAYGVASPGAVGAPTLTGSGCARIGQTITFTSHYAPNSIGLLAFGYAPANVSLAGLTVLQTLDVTLLSVTSTIGDAMLPLAIPMNPWLGYGHLYVQAAYLDGSTATGLAASAGVDLLMR